MDHLADANPPKRALPIEAEVNMNSKRSLNHVFYWLAGVGPLLFIAVATAEGFLRGGYDPIAQPISALAIGPRGWVQLLNFMLLTASFFSFAVVLRAHLQGGVASVAAPGLFWLMTIGVALAGAFPMDAPGASPTLAGRLHDVAGFLVFPWMPIVLLLLARRFRRDAGWRPYFRYTLLTGSFCLATMIFFLLFVGPPSAPPLLASELRGLVQRLILVPFFTWIALVTRRAYLAANHPSVTVCASDASRALS
jgi:hypothetical protein